MKNKNFPNEIINSINKHTFNDLPIKFQKMISKIYNGIPTSIIKVKKIYKCCKNVLLFEIQQKKYYVNVIFDDCEILYTDSVYNFKNILRKCNIKNSVISNVLLFHWADNTTNNTGQTRFLIKDFFLSHNDVLLKTNAVLNDKNYISSLVNNILFIDGNIPGIISYYIFKNEDNWIILSNTELNKIITNQETYIDDNHLHIGPLVLQNKKRNINYDMKFESHRQYLVIRWYNYKNLLSCIQ